MNPIAKELIEMLKWPLVTLATLLIMGYWLIKRGANANKITWKNWKLELGNTVFGARIGNHHITIKTDDINDDKDELIGKVKKLLLVLSESKESDNEFKRELILTKLEHAIYNLEGIDNGVWNITIKQTIVYAQSLLQMIIEKLRTNDEYMAVSSLLFWSNPADAYSGYLKQNFEAAKCGASVRRIMVVCKEDIVKGASAARSDDSNAIEHFLEHWEAMSKEYGQSGANAELKFLYFEQRKDQAEFFRQWRGVGISARPLVNGQKLYSMVKFHKPPREENNDDVELTLTITKEGDRAHAADIRHLHHQMKKIWRSKVYAHGRLLSLNEMSVLVRQLNPGV